jgi:hypothetical protein
MKKILRFMITFMLALMLTGCNKFNIEVKNPNNDSILNGQWKVQNYVGATEGEVFNNALLGSTVSFSNEEVFMFDKVYKNITYKAKVVKGEDYIYNTIGFVPDYLKDSKDIVVVTISSNNIYLKEVIVVDGSILIIQDDVLLYLEKVDDTPMNNINEEVGTEEEEEEISSGVLIGIKDETDEGFVYKTLWIAYDGEKISSQEVPLLLLPRKNGFFKVLTNRTHIDNSYKDNIELVFLSGNPTEKQEEIKAYKEANINVSKEINFVGNDYISIKTKEEGQGQSVETLETYLVDTINIGGKGVLSLGNISEQKNMDKVNNEAQGLYIEDINTFTNVSIERNQGRWGIYTVNSNKNDDNSKNNIEIPLKVSKNVSRYDKLFTSWQGIKNQVPSAVDAISSPNKNMAIIKTKSSLYVYKIVDGKMKESPELTIQLDDNEEIVMSEWAMAEYVGYWAEQVNLMIQSNK